MILQAENMIEHKDEIFSRPKRTWFTTEREKKLIAMAAKVSPTTQLLFVLKYTSMELLVNNGFMFET